MIPDLCGLSIGGWNAANYAARYPKKVNKLVLISPVQTLAKMSKGEAVSMTILEKVCEELDCDFGDIINYERKGVGKIE